MSSSVDLSRPVRPVRLRRPARPAKIWIAAIAAATAAIASPVPALAQHAEQPHGSEAQRAAAGAAGESPTAGDHGTHAGGAKDTHHEHDPSKHFNFIGQTPGHLFDYRGKDEYGGPYGDGKMVDHATGEVVKGEEPASPPFVFMLLNFAVLLGLLAWKGRPIARQVAAERHDLIKTALDEAAKLRKQAADKLAEYETRLKDADTEIKKLVEGMQADALADKIRIQKSAETLAAQMKRDAELRIAAEIELARAQLTREVTAAAAAVTEKLLRDTMTAGDQQKLVTSFIADVQSAASGNAAQKGDVR
jgi:F0F1-type ATP synthase membrane subunit b/b'